MARRKGCGCLTSIFVTLLVVAGVLAGLFFFAKPATFGLRNVGGFELGDFADLTFYQIVKLLGNMDVKEDELVTAAPTPEDEEKYGEQSAELGIQTNEDLLGLLNPDRPVLGTTDTQQVYSQEFYALLFRNIMNAAEDDDTIFAILNAISEQFSPGEGLPGVEISQVLLSNDGVTARVTITVAVNIQNIRDELMEQVPGFLKGLIKLGDKMYLNCTNTLTVDGEGNLQAAHESVQINKLDPSLQRPFLQILLDKINEGRPETDRYTEETLNNLVGEGFCTVSNNLGKAGFYNAESDEKTYSVNAVGNGEITLIVRTNAS